MICFHLFCQRRLRQLSMPCVKKPSFHISSSQSHGKKSNLTRPRREWAWEHYLDISLRFVRSVILRYSCDKYEAADLINRIVEKIEDDHHRLFVARPSKPKLKILRMLWLKVFPKSVFQTRRRLVAKFGTLSALANATEKDLREVEGIGEVMAKRIYDVFRADWHGWDLRFCILDWWWNHGRTWIGFKGFIGRNMGSLRTWGCSGFMGMQSSALETCRLNLLGRNIPLNSLRKPFGVVMKKSHSDPSSTGISVHLRLSRLIRPIRMRSHISKLKSRFKPWGLMIGGRILSFPSPNCCVWIYKVRRWKHWKEWVMFWIPWNISSRRSNANDSITILPSLEILNNSWPAKDSPCEHLKDGQWLLWRLLLCKGLI